MLTFTAMPLVGSLTPRSTLDDTLVSNAEEFPSRAIHFNKTVKKKIEPLRVLQRLVYKNKNQLSTAVSFRKIVLVVRLCKKLELLSTSPWLTLLLSTMLPKNKTLEEWSHLPSQTFLNYGVELSLASLRVIEAIQRAILDAFRCIEQDIIKQLFLPVNVTFMATLGSLYKEVSLVNGVYSRLNQFQLELLQMSSTKHNPVQTLPPVTAKVDTQGINALQSSFWSSAEEIPPVRKTKKKGKKNAIDSIFGSLL